MNGERFALKRADDGALAYVETLLRENDLPAEDLRSSPARFYVGYDGDEPVGVGGVERYGADGLLRSVAVEASARSRGYGTAICDALEARAATDGVETLYLLTTTARGFFADRGYEVIDRSEGPDSIRGTAEFEALCPASATCMRKQL